jgi:glycosyltransferase involved in cell wall biosynthesis
VWDLLAACDVTVSCSHSEASPLAIMEYMGAGRATVATAVGGVPEVVRDGVEGVLVMPDDPEALAIGLAALLDDPQRAEALGAAARTRQVERFSLSAAISRLEAIYEGGGLPDRLAVRSAAGYTRETSGPTAPR